MTSGVSAPLAAVAQLMAYAAKADGRVTPDELEALQQFLAQRYTDASRAEFFALFRDAIDHRPDVERIVSAIREALPGPRDRLRVYAAIQTMLTASGGMSPEESDGLRKVASLLDIPPADADLLAAAGKPAPDFQFPINRERFVRIGQDPSGFLDARPLNLAVMDLGGMIAVSSADAGMTVGDTDHPPGEIAFVEAAGHLRMHGAELGFADLSRLLDLARTGVSRTRWLAVAGDTLIETEPAAFELRLERASLMFVRHDPEQPAQLNGHAVRAGMVVVPSDVLAFDTGEIRISRLLDPPGAAGWPLTISADAAFRYVIADEPLHDADRVLDDLDGSLVVTIDESEDPEAPLSLEVVRHECTTPVRLNGRALDAGVSVPLGAPATLRVGHHVFAIDPQRLKIEYTRRVVERFEARGVTYRFRNTIGLDGISFAASSGELVGIMGGSGAGKSTLLSVLLGVLRPYSGSVLLNGEDLQAQLRRRRSILGYVPQDDLVMDTLTVEENLLYSGRIRLPDMPEAELRDRVERVLREIGLYEQRALRVGNPVSKVLSGGQRKRLNIGLELLANPELFFLDEPTSGLSSQDSQTIITLLDRLTRRGKLVFVVIHQPSSDIFKMFDSLLVLDRGGVQIWYGPARDAIGHFKAYLPDRRDFVECPACGSINPETILGAVEQPAPVFGTPGAARARRFDPRFWQNAYLLRQADTPAPVDHAEPPALLPGAPALGPRARVRALAASIGRTFLDRIRNRTNVVISTAAPLLLAGVMGAMLRGPDVPYTYAGNPALPRFFFLSTVVFVFLGLMASVNEVIREIALIRRERIAGFKATQYIAAKTIAFLPLSLLQVALYTIVASLVLEFPYRAPSYSPVQPPLPFPWYFAIVSFAVVQASFALGLLLSSCLRTQAAAFNWIPLVIIPQILLGGVFVEFTEMPKLVNRVVPEYAEVIFSRWGYEALLAGEKQLNPSDRLNADTILALKQAAEREGRPFDHHAVVEVPRERWHAERALALPPAQLSAAVMQHTLLRQLRVFDRTGDVRLLEESYRSVDRHTYVLRPNLPPGTDDRLAAILMSPDTGWWASTFATRGVNASLESARLEANAPDPERVSPLRQMLTDRSDFPAVMRRVGGTDVPVALFNVLVLAAMAMLCHAAAALRLKYQR